GRLPWPRSSPEVRHRRNHHLRSVWHSSKRRGARISKKPCRRWLPCRKRPQMRRRHCNSSTTASPLLKPSQPQQPAIWPSCATRSERSRLSQQLRRARLARCGNSRKSSVRPPPISTAGLPRSKNLSRRRASPAEPDWGDKAWARLRGLVTIRRIDGAGQTPPEAAVNAAEKFLAAGDLPGAVASLDQLTGQAAEAARPWLQMARQRLAVESALRQIEGLLVARLGAAR